jgi:hypothetical protein
MQWYYSKNATQLGPVSLDELRAKLASGEISGSDMAWREGMPDWRPISSIAELQDSMSGVQAAPAAGSVVNSPYCPPSTAPAQVSGVLIPNYLWQSIVVTILCCWPLGIPAIVYAAKVDGLKAVGDIQGAMSASNSAKTWCWIALGSWGVIVVIYLIFAVAMMAFGGMQGNP